MTNDTDELTEPETTDQLANRIAQWALHHEDESIRADYYFGTRASYCHRALILGEIDANQLTRLRNHAGSLWHYRGD